jgi:stage II sporulation protein AA (anti-sigma F factor antagonist)
MKVVTMIKQGILIVRVEGELDMHSADQFRSTVDKALDISGAKKMLLSLKGVSFIDSSGLGAILGRYKQVSIMGGSLLAANLQPQVEKILELAGLLKIIRVYNSETDALESLSH